MTSINAVISKNLAPFCFTLAKAIFPDSSPIASQVRNRFLTNPNNNPRQISLELLYGVGQFLALPRSSQRGNESCAQSS